MQFVLQLVQRRPLQDGLPLTEGLQTMSLAAPATEADWFVKEEKLMMSEQRGNQHISIRFDKNIKKKKTNDLR